MDYDWNKLIGLNFQPMAPGAPLSPQMTPEELARLAKENNNKLLMVPPEPKPFELPTPQLSVNPVVDTEMSSPQDRAEAANYRALWKKYLGNVDNSIGEQKALLDNVKNMPQSVDWTPTAALFDKWTGGGNQLTKAAESTRGMSPEDRIALVAKLEDQISGKQNELAKNLGSRIDLNNANKMQLALAKMAGTDARFGQSQLLKKEDKLREDVTKSVTSPLLEDTQKIGIMEEAFASGDSQKIMNVLSQYARSISGEKGVLTDQDIVRVMPKNYQGSVASFKAYISSTPSAELPPEYTKSMRELIDITKQRLAQKYEKALKTKKNIYSSGVYRELMTPGSVGDVVFGEAGDALKSFYPQAAGAQSPQVDSPEAWLAKRRGGK